jgi:hypothetical protein
MRADSDLHGVKSTMRTRLYRYLLYAGLAIGGTLLGTQAALGA